MVDLQFEDVNGLDVFPINDCLCFGNDPPVGEEVPQYVNFSLRKQQEAFPEGGMFPGKRKCMTVKAQEKPVLVPQVPDTDVRIEGYFDIVDMIGGNLFALWDECIICADIIFVKFKSESVGREVVLQFGAIKGFTCGILSNDLEIPC
ncbi:MULTISPECIES: hypothetical protein [unclassified Parasaccharibacter]|uniref:hypothetical protein n=1 Tax=unclassified Parasaccharibacter TaxID=2626400 RepID=UPI00117A7627|nr:MULTISPECIES: hypothetical protein [unclassified Parasaccharibacter]